MNGVLVPRKAGCWVCERVAHPEDVTVRLFSTSGVRIAGRGATYAAAMYIEGMGYSMPRRLMTSRLNDHGKHVELSLAGEEPVLPSSLSRVEPAGPVHWLDANQNAINVGNEALGMIVARMPEMEDRELVAVAKIGVTAAQRAGDWEAKGRKLAQIGDLIRLASGMEIEGESHEVPRDPR